MIADSLLTYLEDQGLLTKGDDGYLGFQPAEPDGCVSVYDESAPSSSESQAFGYDAAGVQVLVRDKDYRTARDKSIQIHLAIAGFRHGRFTQTGPYVTLSEIQTAPTSIGSDKQGRHEWSAHYRFELVTENSIHRT